MKLKDFSLLEDNRDHYIIGHPQGRSMKVPKEGLSSKAHQMIGNLKKHKNFQEGGEVHNESEDQSAEQAQPILSDESDETTVALPTSASQVDVGRIPEQIPSTYEEPKVFAEAPRMTAEAEQAASPAQVQPQAAAQPSETQKLYEQATKAVKQEEKTGQTITDINRQLNERLGQSKSIDQVFQDYQTKNAALADAIRTQKIDPTRWLTQQGTGSRIASAIGLLLSGLGSGLTGQPNMAAQNINRAIDEDINAQRNDQSTNFNLLKMNHAMLGSEVQANIATRNQLLIGAKVATESALAQNNSAQARLNATPLLMGLNNQIIQNDRIQAALQAGQPGTEQQQVGIMNATRLADPAAYKELESRYLPGIGIARVPISPKQRDEITTYDSLGKRIQEAIHFQSTEAGTFGTAPFGLSQKAAIANNIANSLKADLNKLYGLNRLTEIEYHNFSDQISNPGSFFTQKSLAQLEDLANQLNSRRQSVYSALGVVPFKQAPSDIQAQAWAQQRLAGNPNDQAARQVLDLAQQSIGTNAKRENARNAVTPVGVR